MGNYHKLSAFMGQWSEMAIFRRFATLNVKNILFLQAELAHLEGELEDIQEEDAASQDPDVKKHDQYWLALSKTDAHGSHCEQYSKFLTIREKLKDYNEALLQYHNLCRLYRPTKHHLSSLRHWLDNKNGGDCFLGAFEADAWEKDEGGAPGLESDLVTMSISHEERDIFSAWLSDEAITWYQNRFGHWGKRHTRDLEGGLKSVSIQKISAFSQIVGTLIASLLPVMSIFVLYFVHDMLSRLGAIMGFSALFAFTLAIFTRAKRIEIFAATAAFASVQVVFVGQPGSNPTMKTALASICGGPCDLGLSGFE